MPKVIKDWICKYLFHINKNHIGPLNPKSDDGYDYQDWCYWCGWRESKRK